MHGNHRYAMTPKQIWLLVQFNQSIFPRTSLLFVPTKIPSFSSFAIHRVYCRNISSLRTADPFEEELERDLRAPLNEVPSSPFGYPRSKQYQRDSESHGRTGARKRNILNSLDPQYGIPTEGRNRLTPKLEERGKKNSRQRREQVEWMYKTDDINEDSIQLPRSKAFTEKRSFWEEYQQNENEMRTQGKRTQIEKKQSMFMSRAGAFARSKKMPQGSPPNRWTDSQEFGSLKSFEIREMKMPGGKMGVALGNGEEISSSLQCRQTALDERKRSKRRQTGQDMEKSIEEVDRRHALWGRKKITDSNRIVDALEMNETGGHANGNVIATKDKLAAYQMKFSSFLYQDESIEDRGDLMSQKMKTTTERNALIPIVTSQAVSTDAVDRRMGRNDEISTKRRDRNDKGVVTKVDIVEGLPDKSWLLNTPESITVQNELMNSKSSQRILRLIDSEKMKNFSPINTSSAFIKLAKMDFVKIRNDPRLTLLVDKVEEQYKTMNTTSLTNVLWSLTRMKLNPRYFPKLIDRCDTEVTSMSTAQLSSCLSSLRGLVFDLPAVKQFKQSLFAEVSQRIDEFDSTSDFCSLAIALGHFKYLDVNLLKQMTKMFLSQINEYDIVDLASIAWSFARVRNVIDQSLFKTICKQVEGMMESSTSEDLISLLWSLSITDAATDDFLRFHMSPTLKTFLMTLNASQLTKIVSSYARANCLDETLITDILFLLKPNIKELTSKEVASLCDSFRRLGLRHSDIFASLATHTIRIASTFLPHNIPTTMRGLAAAGVRNDEVFKVLWHEVKCTSLSTLFFRRLNVFGDILRWHLHLFISCLSGLSAIEYI